MKHVNDHIAEISNIEFHCFHSLCDEQMNDTDLFRQHLSDVHDFIKSQKKTFAVQKKADTKNNDLSSNIHTQKKKKKTQS